MSDTYKALQALYFSGKVKPTLNKVLKELEATPEDANLLLLACKCSFKGKAYESLTSFAERLIALDKDDADAYFYKGMAYQNSKGKEQEALKNFNESIAINPLALKYLLHKATTHLLLYTDYHLPIKFAEKHQAKAEETLMRIMTLGEQLETPSFEEYFILAEANILISRNLEAKKYYMKAAKAFEAADELDQDRNIYKEIIKRQKACIKLVEKFTEDS